ncbi:sodium ABC transporter permease [Pseudoxanthomonas kalamensis DSM 18571]|uniref:ABC transporter permease n=1 Tax=Pseudoxanthomonas kalamensis TaxID=289483 RepID=UPI001391D810|nr:ABC transporter permease [Pseudoxanthomonas kalamensis]KAF1712336.1 sodium ABC transporter permease [Pseudoxanthomonas kalamensis DSM 18571]
MSAMMTVLRKELRDFLRDRRTLIFTLLVGPLIYPLLMIGIGKLTQLRAETQLEKPLEIHIVGAERAPNLVAWLGGQGVRSKETLPGDEARQRAQLDAAVREQREDVGLLIGKDFADDWQAGRPAQVVIVADSTSRNSDLVVARVRAVLGGYGQQVGALRLLARGVDPGITRALGVEDRDLATPEAKRGLLLSVILPLLLVMWAFIGGAHISMDATAGERERQSLEPLLATPASRGAIVSGKMLAAALLGVTSLVLTLLSFKISSVFASGAMRSLDVSPGSILSLLLVLLPLVLIGTALLTFLSAAAKSMKEAQSHMGWLIFLPMIPSYALMAYPLKNTALWQYAVPFLAQNQMLVKITRGESPSPEQWTIYLACSFGLALLLWAAAVWRYRQEKLAISG